MSPTMGETYGHPFRGVGFDTPDPMAPDPWTPRRKSPNAIYLGDVLKMGGNVVRVERIENDVATVRYRHTGLRSPIPLGTLGRWARRG